MIDLMAQAFDDLGGRPLGIGRVLLELHLVEDGQDPVFELAVVLVGHDEVTNAVESQGSPLFALDRAERFVRCQVCRAETFDQIFLYPSRRRHNH